MRTESTGSPRFRTPGWKDLRVLIGILLVAASVAATWWVVDTANRTVRVWAAAESLVPGADLTPEDLVAVEVNLTGSAEKYLSAAEDLPAGSTVLSLIGPGELLPASQVRTVDRLRGRVIALAVPDELPSAVTRGTLVDIWSTDVEVESPDPRELLRAVPVIAVARDGGDFTTVSGTRLEVFVPTEKLGEVLRAQAAEHRISVAAVPGRAAGESPAEEN